MKRLGELRYGFIVLNPFLLLPMLVCCRETVFATPALAAAVLAFTLTTYVVSLVKKVERAHTAASALLLLLDLRFVFLLAANAVLPVWIAVLETPLPREIGYPLFQRIEIVFKEPRP